MEIYQLRAFVSVAKHGNFTRAAKELHLSQPTVSGQIKALEEHLGLVLLERKAGGVVPTSGGLELLQRAEKILAEVRGLAAHAKDLGERVTGKLRMGTVIEAKLLRVGTLLSEMRIAYPNIEIETQHGLSGWVLSCVRNGELDCGFFVGPIADSDLHAIHLSTLNYRIVAPAAWAQKVADADWTEIAAMPWVWAPEQGSYPQLATEMFREHGVEPMKVASADRESTIINLVTAGVGLAMLRDSVALAAAETKELVIWKNGAKQANLSFVYMAERKGESVLIAATNIIQKIWMQQ